MIKTIEYSCLPLEKKNEYFIKGFMESEEEKLHRLDYERQKNKIDNEIQEIVAEINTIQGVASIFSCYGHIDKISGPSIYLRVDYKKHNLIIKFIEAAIMFLNKNISISIQNNIAVLTGKGEVYRALTIRLFTKRNLYLNRDPKKVLERKTSRTEFWDCIRLLITDLKDYSIDWENSIRKDPGV